jgi:hypothetical protein
MSLRAQILRERWFGDELPAEISRTLSAYEAGRIDEQELADWVGSWVAQAKQRLQRAGS